MLALKPEECTRHIVYVYRWVSDGVAALTTKLPVPFDDYDLKEIVGGGTFRLIMKNGPQICRRIERFLIEGKPKLVEDNHAPAALVAPNGGESNAINRLCNLLEMQLTQQNGGSAGADAFKGALSLQEVGFKSVLENVAKMTPTPTPNAGPFQDIKGMLEFMALAKNLFAPSGGNSIKETLEMIAALKDSGLVGGGDGKGSMMQEVLRLAPAVLGQIGQGMNAMAQARIAEANAVSGRQAIPIAPNPLPPAAAIPPAVPQQPPPAVVGANEIIPWIESKIADLVMDDSLTATEAASDALTFLNVGAPVIMKQLIDGGENTLHHIFNNEPAFARVPKNPRLTEFIKKFLELGAQYYSAPAIAPPPASDLSTNDQPKPA